MQSSRTSTAPLKLVPEDYANYLKHYEDTLIKNYMEGNNEEEYYHLQSRHSEIDETLRAKLIDWVQHCTSVCSMEEKNIFFLVINLIDTFYKTSTEP